MPLIQGLNKGVYRWVNKVNGKVYVGSATKTLQKRHDRYVKDFAKGRCHNKHLLQAWQKYGGREAFRFEVLEVCGTSEECLVRETWWIAHYDSTDHSKGYNVCKQGKNQAGAKRTNETKAQMSASAKARGCQPYQIAQMARKNLGRAFTEDHKESLKENHWSKGPDAETIKETLREANLGKEIPQEQRDQISETLTGRKQSEDVKAKKRETWANKTEDEKAVISNNLSKALTGHVKSDQHRENLSKAAKADWARRKAEKAAREAEQRGEEGT